MRWLSVALMTSACLKSSSQTCSSGDQQWVCPSGFACAEPDVFCGRANEVAACDGHDAFTGCTFTDEGSNATAVGACVKGVCTACSPDVEGTLEGCTYPGWQTMTAPATVDFRGVAVVGPADAYVVSDHSVLHYDGQQWVPPTGLPALTDDNLALDAVWAGATNDVFVVLRGVPGSFGGDVMHFDGATWTVDPSSQLVLQAVTGTPDGKRVIVAGTQGLTGMIRDFDRTSWTESDVGGAPLAGVWASNTRAIAVGGAAGVNNAAVAWRSDGGAAWAKDTFPQQGIALLAGVWGSSDTDVYAVGRDVMEKPAIAHFDGVMWSIVPFCADATSTACIDMSLASLASALTGVWGSSASDVYAVGVGGTILHFDGSRWTLVDPSTTPPPTDLSAVSGGGSDVIAVGSGGAIWRDASE